MHSTLLAFVGHFVWSMYGNRLTHVWFTQTKLLPQGVPSRTKPFSVKSRDTAGPLVVLQIFPCLWKNYGKNIFFKSNAITHLHSYSTPLIDMIVFELKWSKPAIFGWRSPSLHCNEPHLTFLQGKKYKKKIKPFLISNNSLSICIRTQIRIF